MVVIAFHISFQKKLKRIKDPILKNKVIKQIEKLRENPEIGKPMRFLRRGTREIYIHPFRLSYCFIKKEDKIVLLELYHKDEQ